MTLVAAGPVTFALGVSGSAPAQAFCSSSDGTVTCTGDWDTNIEYTSSSGATTLDIKSVTNDSYTFDIGGLLFPAVYFSDSTDDGDSDDLSVTINTSSDPDEAVNLDGDPSDFVLTADWVAVYVYSEAGDASDASSKKDIFATSPYYGHTGGDGGDAGEVYTFLTAITVNAAESGLIIGSVGGDGGNGGEAQTGTLTSAHGGEGGDGGDTEYVLTALIDTTINKTEANSAALVDIRSTGGDGGTGGTGRTGAPSANANGGAAGDGGHSENNDLVFYGDVSIVSEKEGGVAVWVEADGGQGGAGGYAKNSDGDAHGGSGGTGGWGGDLSVDITYDGGENGEAIDPVTTVYIQSVDAAALVVQSVAGDGGNGGDAYSAFNNAYGGDGGAGGDGGSIQFDLNNGLDVTIAAEGDYAPAVFGRSYGGAGGDGGDSSSFIDFDGGGGGGDGAGSGNAGSVTFNLDNGLVVTNGTGSDAVVLQSVGGFSGDGGDASGIVAYGGGSESAGTGGKITVDIADSEIVTDGLFSDALFFQSVGGGGGKGGDASGLAAVGGTGSAGGDSNGVVATIAGTTIETNEDYSRGIVAQGIGGGGGDGGSSEALVALGGSGSVGGTGGHVSVSLDADSSILTQGDYSDGILAQSIGGGGGSGHSSSSLKFSLGGDGGSGADADSVYIYNGTDITTEGDHSHGMVGQSIGGSGGRGSNATTIGALFSFSMSGTGGTGSDGGTVLIHDLNYSDIDYTVKTSGDHSIGVLAQSIGGGGGNAGNALSAGASVTPTVEIAIGGKGGAGGDGGHVDMYYRGGVTTAGDHSVGIMAMSTGGGGGNAGTTLSLTAASSAALDFSIGGDAGGAGDGGNVNVCRAFTTDFSSETGYCEQTSHENATNKIKTAGDASHGILAASVGGSGGHSGVTVAASGVTVSSLNVSVGGNGGAGGDGKEVFVASSGGIVTEGDLSNAILAKSVGGAGGASYLTGSVSGISESGSLGLSVGGDGGSGGASGDVYVHSVDDTISTSGEISSAIVALSTGGSGGAGGVALSGSALAPGAFNMSLGGDGGAGGTASEVWVQTSGDISTTGNLSDGILAASVGGAGGTGGTSISGTLVSAGNFEVSVGGAAGDGGTSDAVHVSTTDGSISTEGDISIGIFAASIGGSGGKGGSAFSTTGISQEKASITVGGDGGDGGESGLVDLDNLADITTGGMASPGIVAQSIGGHGGAGGYAAQGGISVTFDAEIPAASATFVIGGDGGAGGTASTVSVTNSGEIQTTDFASAAVVAQSIGGSGGTGGNVYSANAQAGTEGTEISVEFDIGGDGGKGGVGEDVTVTNNSTIITKGHASQGVIAQSIVGNGGAGGSSYNSAISLEDQSENSVTLTTVVGGDGGDGGQSGIVTVDNYASITTSGNSSSAIYAQSVGGNGGNGGNAGNISFETAFSDDDDDDEGDEDEGDESEEDGAEESTVNVAMEFRVGGDGGDGAIADAVYVTNESSSSFHYIRTYGANSHGMFAQSIGGNGGDGGSTASYDLSMSGVCDFTQVRETTASCNDDSEDDDSDESDDSDDDSTESEFSFTGTFGGDGGDGMDAGVVQATNSAIVTTSGAASHGIMVQSVGGGGGVGGSTGGGLEAFTSNQTAQDIDSVYEDQTSDTPYEQLTNFTDFTLTIGGAGGAAGQGGEAIVENSSYVTTEGEGSYGIFAQSIGGGGGAAGSASGDDTNSLTIGSAGGSAGDGGAVNVTNYSGASIATSKQRSIAILAQSIGGGGGTTDVAPGVDLSDLYNDALLNFTIGGQEGASGDGGAVTVTNTDTTITTWDLYSPAIFAQSVGGGGGAAFGSVEGATGTTIVGGQGDTDVSDDDTDYGDTSGDGGDVTVIHSGTINTAYDTDYSDSYYSSAGFGIFAQSVGGGGGYAGAVTFGKSSLYGSDLTDMSGSTDTSGDGGDVKVTASGDITTNFGGSVGIFAQSVGGGGGVAGMADSTNTTDPLVYIGNGGGSGTGGTVTVDYSDGTITTSGEGAHGIFAQSAGGPSSTTTSDTKVSVTVSGDISVSGSGAHGIFAQSVGEGTGKIAVEIEEGATVSGGDATIFDDGEDGAGVFIKNGTEDSTLTNYGTITSVLGSDGVAINVKDTTVTVNNHGSITGDWLKASEIHAHNHQGGFIQAGETLMADSLHNDGDIAIGHADVVSQSSIEGHLTQSGVGNLVITLDPGVEDATNRTDNLTIGGDALMDGTVEIQIAEGWSPGYGESISQFLTVEGTADLGDLTIRRSAAGQFELLKGEDGTSHLKHHIDFANANILAASNENQRRISRVIHQLYVDPDFVPEDFAELLYVETPEEYAATMDSFGSEILSHGQTASLLSAHRFKEDLLSCPQRSGTFRYFDQGQCTWYRLGAQRVEQDGTRQTLGFSENAWRMAVGGQFHAGNDWILGGGLSYEDTLVNTPDANANSKGDRFQIGATVKRQFGNFELASAFTFGVTRNDITRNPYIGGTTSGDQDIWSQGAHFRVSTLLEQDNWYVMPRVGLGVDHQYVDDYSETGGTYALGHESRRDTNVHVHLGTDIGTEFTTDTGLFARTRLTLGLTQFLTDPSPSATTSFANSDISEFGFDGSSLMDKTRLDIGGGIDVFTVGGNSLQLELVGGLSEHSRSIGGHVKLAIQF